MENKDKILMYDDDCPLCALYTSAFVRTGLLDAAGRKAFSCARPELLQLVDVEKSRNEIPLIDASSGKVLYGIDALLEILGRKMPWIRTTGSIPPVKWMLRRLYKFISYNRKVIVAKKSRPGAIDCTPSFNAFYRILFMSIFLLFNTWMLVPVHRLILLHLPFYHSSMAVLQCIHLGLVCLNCLLALTLGRREAIEYLGQVNMLALMTVLLMIPLMLWNKIAHSLIWVTMIYLLLVTIVIIKEYFRRMQYADICGRRPAIVIVNCTSLAVFIAAVFLAGA